MELRYASGVGFTALHQDVVLFVMLAIVHVHRDLRQGATRGPISNQDLKGDTLLRLHVDVCGLLLLPNLKGDTPGHPARSFGYELESMLPRGYALHLKRPFRVGEELQRPETPRTPSRLVRREHQTQPPDPPTGRLVQNTPPKPGGRRQLQFDILPIHAISLTGIALELLGWKQVSDVSTRSLYKELHRRLHRQLVEGKMSLRIGSLRKPVLGRVYRLSSISDLRNRLDVGILHHMPF